jgi:RimJ/RimL family protein N-acetyltransferase
MIETTTPLRMRTQRLEMVAATDGLMAAEQELVDKLAALLDVDPPAQWPPDLTEDVMPILADLLRDEPGMAGWLIWFLIHRPEDAPGALVGVCGFKGRPDGEGYLEVGYSLLEDFRGNGYATEALGGLVAWAFGHAEVRGIIAETFPGHRSSIRVLERNGFSHIGTGVHRGTIRFRRLRSRKAVHY